MSRRHTPDIKAWVPQAGLIPQWEEHVNPLEGVDLALLHAEPIVYLEDGENEAASEPADSMPDEHGHASVLHDDAAPDAPTNGGSTLPEVPPPEPQHALSSQQPSVQCDKQHSSRRSFRTSPTGRSLRVSPTGQSRQGIPRSFFHCSTTASQWDEIENRNETEVQKFQARIKRTVADDIQQMLQNSKAYVKHHSSPPTISHDKLCTLSIPKTSAAHTDTVMVLQSGCNYTTYAQQKAAQLQQARHVAERQQAQHDQDAQLLAGQLQSYQQWKAQREEFKQQVLAREAAEKQQYGRQLATYVAKKAERELAGIQAKQQAAKERAAVLHAQLVTGTRVWQ